MKVLSSARNKFIPAFSFNSSSLYDCFLSLFEHMFVKCRGSTCEKALEGSLVKNVVAASRSSNRQSPVVVASQQYSSPEEYSDCCNRSTVLLYYCEYTGPLNHPIASDHW